MNKRIGIFSGTFDPIHVGHLEACLVAKGALELDEVLVMIEGKPYQKNDVTDYSHRKKMVELALTDFKSIKLFEAQGDNITFVTTAKLLKKNYQKATEVIIIGSDMLDKIITWPGFDSWANSQELAIILRSNEEQKKVTQKQKDLSKNFPKLKIHILPAVWSPVSSSTVKQQISKTGHCDLIHRNVMQYIKQNKLYASVPSK